MVKHLKLAASVTLGLYLISLHVSMAGMEIFGWLSAVLGMTLVIKNQTQLKTAVLLVPLFGFVLVSLFGLLINPELKSRADQIGFLRFVFLYAGLVMALSSVWSIDFERRLIRIWGVMLGVVGGYAFWQMLTGVDLIPRSKPVIDYIGGIYKATGFFSMSLTFAYVIGLSLWGAGPMLVKKKYSPWGVAAVTFGALGLIASTARGAWLASLICALIYVGFVYRRWLIPVTAAFVASISLAIWFGSQFGILKFSELAHLRLDHSSFVRFELWRAYGAIFFDHPWFGVGLFQGDRLLPQYYLSLGVPNGFVSHAHNNLMQILAGTGVFGFFFYAWAAFLGMICAWRIRWRSTWGWPLFLSQLFFHLGGMTECNFLDGEVNHFLMFIWALVSVIYVREMGAALATKKQS